MIVALPAFQGFHKPSSGGGGAPSTPEIIITGNAEIEAGSNDLFPGFSGALTSGVAGAHGRVYSNTTFQNNYAQAGAANEFVSMGARIYNRVDVADTQVLFRQSASPFGIHIRVLRNADGTFSVTAPGGTLATTSTVVAILTWFYITLYARIHDTTGEFTAKLFDASGSLLETLTGSSANTKNGTLDGPMPTWGGASADTYVDHLWQDVNGAFRGCGYVETRQATANGDTNSWTRGGTDTGNNWDQIDEVPKNTSSYVFSSGADQVELYNFQDQAQAGPIVTVQQVVYAHAHTAGTREWKPICKIGGVVYEGATQSTTDTNTFADPVVINWQNDPSTGAAWTDSGYNAAQFGAKSVTTDVRIQAMCLQILVDIES